MFGSFSGSPRSACADARQEGEQRARLEDAGAQRVDHRQLAAPDRVDQAGRAEPRLLVELQRIGEGASRRRHSTLTGARPATVRTMTWPFSTVRSSPSSSMKPR